MVVFQLLQDADLAQSSFSHLVQTTPPSLSLKINSWPAKRGSAATYIFVVIAVFELLDGDVGPRGLVLRFVHDAIRSTHTHAIRYMLYGWQARVDRRRALALRF